MEFLYKSSVTDMQAEKDSLAQNYNNSSALAMELPQSCNKPLKRLS